MTTARRLTERELGAATHVLQRQAEATPKPAEPAGYPATPWPAHQAIAAQIEAELERRRQEFRNALICVKETTTCP